MILDSFRLTGKNALVTGSSRGMGAAIAIALAEAGANVALHGSKPISPHLIEQIEARGARAAAFTADLAKPESAPDLVEKTIDAFGSIDILVNNAGTIHRATAVEFPFDEWNRVIATNMSSVFRMCQTAAKSMIARGSGKIVNMASLLSFQGGVGVPAYAAAKGAVAQLTKALANEWAPHGVQVNAIAPGYIATDLTQALQDDPVRSRQILERIPAGRWGNPQDIAATAIFLASPASDYINGHILVVDGGWLGR